MTLRKHTISAKEVKEFNARFDELEKNTIFDKKDNRRAHKVAEAKVAKEQLPLLNYNFLSGS